MVVAVGVGGGGGEGGRRGVHLAARAATYTWLVLPPIGRTLVSLVRGFFDTCKESVHISVYLLFSFIHIRVSTGHLVISCISTLYTFVFINKYTKIRKCNFL